MVNEYCFNVTNMAWRLPHVKLNFKKIFITKKIFVTETQKRTC